MEGVPGRTPSVGALRSEREHPRQGTAWRSLKAPGDGGVGAEPLSGEPLGTALEGSRWKWLGTLAAGWRRVSGGSGRPACPAALTVLSPELLGVVGQHSEFRIKARVVVSQWDTECGFARAEDRRARGRRGPCLGREVNGEPLAAPATLGYSKGPTSERPQDRQPSGAGGAWEW